MNPNNFTNKSNNQSNTNIDESSNTSEKTSFEKFFKLLPESLRKIIERHQQILDNATADYMKGEVVQYQKRAEAESKRNSNLNMKLVNQIVEVIVELLNDFQRLSEDNKMVISAMVRYFLDTDDAQDDFLSPFGFDDDMAVVNAALIAIGRDAAVITR